MPAPPVANPLRVKAGKANGWTRQENALRIGHALHVLRS